jgi:hypothetical protein
MRKSMGACKIVTSCWSGAMKASALPKCFIYNSPGEDLLFEHYENELMRNLS